ncbi:hypothetical protein [Geodermatophilus nigrescens]|uniref:Uncharacterized protein n=1 Tax=Geodermatophilus nigrescens TaxID=1070870 RepID=A0A1M5E930_9ACTN|nr:hypothetical protein [Geodermatophilus nigrescens]SHF75690.1 hypothetical protein SAMN05444351_0699 [Geodermatophilus nigrescens]
MPRRDPREARALGLWTAGWLFGLLLAGLLWIGDLSVQWPVLLVPALWALVALRPRRRLPRRPQPEDDRWDVPYEGGPPPTWELPASRPLPRPPDARDRGTW